MLFSEWSPILLLHALTALLGIAQYQHSAGESGLTKRTGKFSVKVVVLWIKVAPYDVYPEQYSKQIIAKMAAGTFTTNTPLAFLKKGLQNSTVIFIKWCKASRISAAGEFRGKTLCFIPLFATLFMDDILLAFLNLSKTWSISYNHTASYEYPDLSLYNIVFVVSVCDFTCNA